MSLSAGHRRPPAAARRLARAPRRALLALAIAAALGLGLVTPAGAVAVQFTWTGAQNGKWDNSASNWVPSCGAFESCSFVPAPGFGTNDTVVFNNNRNTTITGKPTMDPASHYALGTITFGASAGAFTIATSDIWLKGGVRNDSSLRQTFTAGMGLYGSQTLSGGSAGLLIQKANLVLAGSTVTLEKNVTINELWMPIGVLPGDSSALNILGGSSATFSALVLGVEDGSSGAITVDGAGSRLIVTPAAVARVGQAGLGGLMVGNGGSASFSALVLGQDYGSTGNTSVTGAKSVLSAAADIVVGQGGTGTLTVAHLGAVKAASMVIGQGYGSMGTVVLDGSDRVLESLAALPVMLQTSGDLVVGGHSTGTLTLAGVGKALVIGNASIGQDTGGDGLVVLKDFLSEWEVRGDVLIGDAGFGRLKLETGARATQVNATLGRQAGSAGTAEVSGWWQSPDYLSRWTLSGHLQVGALGEGFLTIADRGLVINQTATIGQVGDPGTSRATVTGSGSRWQTLGALAIHSGGLAILDGGQVLAQQASFADGAGRVARINLSGAGSALTVSGSLSLGDGGSATLDIGSGAVLTTGVLVLGSGGTVNLRGGTLALDSSTGSGGVDWNAGIVNYTGSARTGAGLLGHQASLGQGMQLVVNGDLVIAAGDGISLNGGQAQAARTTVQGELAVGSQGEFLAGANGLVNTGAVLLAGGRLHARAVAENRGFWSGYGAIVGEGSFVNAGLLQQSGGSLELATTASNLNLGNWNLLDGRGLVLSGARLQNEGVMSLNGDTISGAAQLYNGVAGTLSGRGVISTPFLNEGSLIVDSGNLRVDQFFENKGQILLGAAGASLSGAAVHNSGLLQGLGRVNNDIRNTGSLNAAGGLLSLTGTLTNTGTLSAGTGASLRVVRGLAHNSGRIQLAGGAFDNNGQALNNDASGVISGFGSVSGGTLTNQGRLLLSGGSSALYADIVSSNASQIVLSGNSNTTFYGNLDVQSGAELRVSTGSVATFFGNVQQRTGARFTGSGSKRFEGGLTVGASPGLGIDEGDVEFGESARYLAEIGGTSACSLLCGSSDAVKNSSFDKYVVRGNLSLAGTLTLVSWNGFVGHAGQQFDLLDWGTLTGTFDRIDASGFKLAAGTQLDTSALYSTGTIAVVAAPVPEPGTLALWLAGLAGLGSLARRRRGARAGA